MQDKDMQHELFALKVLNAVQRVYSPTMRSTRSGLRKKVAYAVKTLDYEGDYVQDGGKMVDYVTDALCSNVGIEAECDCNGFKTGKHDIGCATK